MAPLVAREREVEELLGGLEHARAGRGRLYVVVGEPGIGKTRLAHELATQAASSARILWGLCWEAGGAPPYWPWIQVLRDDNTFARWFDLEEDGDGTLSVTL